MAIDNAAVEVVCTFVYSVHRSPDTGFTVAKYRECDTDKTIFATGTDLPVTKNAKIRLTGEWETRKGRRQLRVLRADFVRGADGDGIAAYLSSLRVSVGKKRAAAILKAFGADAWRVLDEEPERLSMVPGIGDALAGRIVAAIREDGQLRAVMRLFADANLEIPPRRAARLVQKLGNDAVDKIRTNPYCVYSIEGISFEMADRLALRRGMQKADVRRVTAGLCEMFQRKAMRGHVCYPKEAFVKDAASFLEVDVDICKSVANILARKGTLKCSGGMLYSRSRYEQEVSISNHLHALMVASGKVVNDISPLLDQYEQENFPLAEKQKQAVRSIFENTVNIITGGPGVGKTTVIRAILTIFSQVMGQSSMPVLLAPTGRAAKRMSEATGYPASTIHSAVKITEDGEDHHAGETIDGNLFIVDEASMADQFITATLLSRITPGSRVVFVGDPHQLPSVGCGNILLDMIQSGVVPTTTLDVVFRQAKENPIVSFAYEINRGNSDLPNAETVKFLERQSVSSAFSTAVSVYERAVKVFGLDNVVLLSPFREYGDLSVVSFNRYLQEKLNPLKPGDLSVTLHGTSFRVNDKVMQRKNTEWAQNGDVGYIRAITRRPAEDDPREWVYTVDIEFNGDGRIHHYSQEQMQMIDLAFCSTIHKVQGEEYHTVVMVVSEEHRSMLQRNLIYTGFTRAKQNVILVGTRAAFKMAVDNDKSVVRHTLLKQRLRQTAGQQR